MPFVGGAALSTITFLGGWIVQQMRAEKVVFTLEYRRATGWNPKWADGKTDPARDAASVSEYVLKIATKCRLRSWRLETNDTMTDVDETAWLRTDAGTLNDKSFNCLTSFVSPPYVRLLRESLK